jgi:arylsulfatase A
MNWSHGHNGTIHNGISRIGFYTGGHAARFRDEDLADQWVKQSNEWLTEHKDQPFFLYFAAHDIHVPRMPHERFQGKTSLGYRGDAIVEFDWCVGELVKTIEKLGLAEKTLFIVTSDNGPVLDDGYVDGAVEKLGSHKPAGPYSGGKYSVLEGGTRVLFVTRWKGHIKPAVADEVVCTVDLPASLAKLTGVELAADGCRDSFDVLDALLGEPGAKGREHLLQQNNGGGNFGLRSGNWKLVRLAGQRNAKGKKGAGKGQAQDSLYDLATDPGEKNDVGASHPEVRERLSQLLDKLIADGHSRPGASAAAGG